MRLRNRPFEMSVLTVIVVTLAVLLSACGDSTGPTPPPPPSNEVFGTRITFERAQGPSTSQMAFDVTTIADSVNAGDVISIDVLVEDSTESGWVAVDAGRSVSLFIDDDFRAFDQIETNDAGHALLDWVVPNRAQVDAGAHVITAKLTIPTTGVQLTPDSILFNVKEAVITYQLRAAVADSVVDVEGVSTAFMSNTLHVNETLTNRFIQNVLEKMSDGVSTGVYFTPKSSEWVSTAPDGCTLEILELVLRCDGTPTGYLKLSIPANVNWTDVHGANFTIPTAFNLWFPVGAE